MNLPIAKGSLLYLDNVHRAFDGYKAINGLSFLLAHAEMRAIIGPNGAGKTTMMDIITGKTRPDRGDVLFLDGTVDLTRRDEADIATLGIGRKFQRPTVFESHTVADNLDLALKAGRGAFTTLFHRGNDARRRRVAALLDIVRLGALRRRLAAELSHGQKQWLEIGMLLAQEPRLLLVDEPVAGMTDAETLQTAALLKDIARTQAVVVVEHDMGFVRELGVKVTCLHEGAVLAEGSFEAVSANPAVVDVYLGR